MGYLLNAWLEDGAPRLRIINPADGETSLAWDCPNLNQANPISYRHELQTLVRKLLLLSCAQESFLNQKQISRSDQHAQ